MDKRSPRRGKTVRRVLSLGALLVAVGFAPAVFADLVPGGGKTAGDCLVELDVTEQHEPNIFLNAAMVSSKQLFIDTKQVVVPPTKNFLTVEVKPDRAQYQPRRKARSPSRRATIRASRSRRKWR